MVLSPLWERIEADPEWISNWKQQQPACAGQ
jgi:hypothetical protein